MPILDANWRKLKDGADITGWPTPDQPVAARRAHNRANTAPAADCYRRIAQGAQEFAAAGFEAVGFGPSCMGAAGKFSAGYDLRDNYDIGSKGQPTGFGWDYELRAAVAAVHAAGMDAYGDLVLHQYDGFDPTKRFSPPTRAGVPTGGRFPKKPSYFVGAPPGVMVDPVPDSQGNFGFGAMASYQNSTPRGEMLAETIRAAQWLAATVGFDGFRIDDVKGTNAPAVLELLRAPGLAHLYTFGEYYDGNSSAVWNWVNSEMQRRAAALDFGFKFNVENICNNNSRAWMGALSSIGYCLVDSYMAVPFVESADTDNSPFEQTIWNKALGYAILLTFPGNPRIYYRDWADDPDCYGLKPVINNLLWIHKHLAQGAFIPRLDTDPQVFMHERTGLEPGAGCIAAFNNDQWNAYTRTCETTFWPNTRLHCFNADAPDLWTGSRGELTVEVPRNVNGSGVRIYGQWTTPEGFGLRPRVTNQVFYGSDAVDDALDIPAAKNGLLKVGTINCAVGTDVGIDGTVDRTGWTAKSSVTMSVTEPGGAEILVLRVWDDTPNPGPTIVRISGTHTLFVWGENLPEGGSNFLLSAFYTAPLETADVA